MRCQSLFSAVMGNSKLVYCLVLLLQFNLSFVATDDKGASATWSPTINMCACDHGGQCVRPEEGDKVNTDSKFVYMGCTCQGGYTGRFCDSDIDACESNGQPCYTGVECTDLPPPANASGYKCGPCPSGYTGDGAHCVGKFEHHKRPLTFLTEKHCDFSHQTDYIKMAWLWRGAASVWRIRQTFWALIIIFFHKCLLSYKNNMWLRFCHSTNQKILRHPKRSVKYIARRFSAWISEFNTRNTNQCERNPLNKIDFLTKRWIWLYNNQWKANELFLAV